MNSWFVRRAKTARTLGFVVVLAGFLPVLFFMLHSFLRVALLPDALPSLRAGWLDAHLARLPLHKVVWLSPELYAGLAIALAGLLVMLLGAAIARRQMAVLEAAKRVTEDRLRRVHQYMGDGRIEPYIGRVITIPEDVEPR
jgi:hypothetical protein